MQYIQNFIEQTNSAWVLFCIALSAVTCYVCQYLRLIRLEVAQFRHVPGPPKPSYLFGHVFEIKRAMEHTDMMIQDLLYEWAQKYGPTFKIFIFHKAVIVTAHPLGIKETLLGGHPKADELYGRLVNLYGVRFLGTGLVTLTDNSSWEYRRRAMDPAFKRQFLKGLMEQFNSTSDVFIRKLQKYADGKTVVSMSDEFHRITLDLIGKVAFSMDIDSIHDDTSPFPAAIHTILEAMYSQLFKGDFGMNPWNRAFYKKSREAVLFLRKVGKELIDSREAAMLRGEKVPEDILSHAIRLSSADEPELSIESMIDDFITFFIAGHETAANTLSFILLELGRNPEILQRVREEISVEVGSNESLTYSNIQRLSYMNMVVKESMRLYPTAPSTFRKLNKICDIGGYRIPKDTIVMVSNFVASRNSKVFERPLEFIPERFDPRVAKEIPIYSCIPFSLGPRSCIGKTFAQIQTKVILTKFLLNFDIDLDMTQPFGMMEVATLKPKSKVNCHLRMRKETVHSPST